MSYRNSPRSTKSTSPRSLSPRSSNNNKQSPGYASKGNSILQKGGSKKNMKKNKSLQENSRQAESLTMMLNAYTDSLQRLEGQRSERMVFQSPSHHEPTTDNIGLLKAQHAQLLEENSFIKARLNAELKERHILDARNKELNKKFMESRKALQSTGEMLLKVHNQITEMRSKSDEREVQLEDSLELNKNLTSKLVDLENKLEGINTNSSTNQGTVLALKKMISEKEDHIHSLEEQQLTIQGQISKLRRENYRLTELTTEQQDNIESKDRKIITLEKKASTLVEVLGQMQITAAESMIRQSIAPPIIEKPSTANSSPRKQVRNSGEKKPKSADNTENNSRTATANNNNNDELFSATAVVEVSTLPNVALDPPSTDKSKLTKDPTLTPFNDIKSSSTTTATTQPVPRNTVINRPTIVQQSTSTEQSTTKSIGIKPSPQPTSRSTVVNQPPVVVANNESWKDVLRAVTPNTPSVGATREIIKKVEATTTTTVAPITPVVAAAVVVQPVESKPEPTARKTVVVNKSNEPPVVESAKSLINTENKTSTTTTNNVTKLASSSQSQETINTPSNDNDQSSSSTKKPKSRAITGALPTRSRNPPTTNNTPTEYTTATTTNTTTTTNLSSSTGAVVPPTSSSSKKDRPLTSSSPPGTPAEKIDENETCATISSRYNDAKWNTAFIKKSDQDENAYKEQLTKYKKTLKKDVVNWTKLFKAEHGREPAKDDRKNFGFPIFNTYGNLSKAIKNAGMGDA